MNALINLVTFYNHLPIDNTYRAIAKGILENLDQMKNATIYDVAELTASSRAQIWRMLKMLGYRSYPEFSNELRRILEQPFYYNWAFHQTHAVQPNGIVAQAIQTMNDVGSLLQKTCTDERLDYLTALLNCAECVRFYQLPTSRNYFLTQNLVLAGKSTGEFALVSEMLKDTEELNEKSLVFTSPLEFSDMIDMTTVYEEVKKRGAMLILGQDAQSRYARYGDLLLFDFEKTPQERRVMKRAYEELLAILSDVFRIKYMKE